MMGIDAILMMMLAVMVLWGGLALAIWHLGRADAELAERPGE